MKLLVVAIAAVALSGVHAGCFSDPMLAKKRLMESELLRANHPKSQTNGANDAKTLSHLPKQFDWCNLPDGRNLCTPSWNQHIPVYCGSCWLHATLSSIQDRIYIQQGGKYPPVMLARQTVLNCAPFHGLSNGCHGGLPHDVFEFMRVHGLPDEGCQVYDAIDHTKYGENATSCPPEGYCINCMVRGEEEAKTKECWGVEHPIRYYIKEWGPIPRHNVAAMMQEIYENGPITCGMISYDDFSFNYTGGVWQGNTTETQIDHEVEVVGWGEDPVDGPYWIVRNSWGTYWGEMGFFKLKRGVNHLMIEQDCWYGVPDSEDERQVRAKKLTGSMYGLVKADPKGMV